MENFSQNLIKEIESRNIEPRSKLYFLLKRSVFWVSAIISILIGGLSFAVADYVFFDNDFKNLSSLNGTPILEIAKSVPYIWLFSLGLFTVAAYIGFRHTRKGYRYATFLVIIVSILSSILLGLILNKFDFGQNTHKYLLKNTKFYDGLIHTYSESNSNEENSD